MSPACLYTGVTFANFQSWKHPEAKDLLIIQQRVSNIYGADALKSFLSKPSTSPPDLSGSFDKYFVTSSTIIFLNLNAWMLSGPFQYKSPGSFENFEFRFWGASTKYLLNVSAFRFFGIDLKLILSGRTDFNSSHILRGICKLFLFYFWCNPITQFPIIIHQDWIIIFDSLGV